MRLVVLVLIAFASAALAKEPIASGKFTIEGGTLSYNTEDMPGDVEGKMEDDDVAEMLDLLRRHQEIVTLRLNSSGGSVWAGKEMARIVLDFELDTEVSGICSSACPTVLLGGKKRTLQRGGKIGFHRSNWSPDDIENYYHDERMEEGWDTPFEYGAWIYADTQEEVYQDLVYLVSRGVDAHFAIRTKEYFSTMWYPTRRELTEAGVLRD